MSYTKQNRLTRAKQNSLHQSPNPNQPANPNRSPIGCPLAAPVASTPSPQKASSTPVRWQLTRTQYSRLTKGKRL